MRGFGLGFLRHKWRKVGYLEALRVRKFPCYVSQESMNAGVALVAGSCWVRNSLWPIVHFGAPSIRSRSVWAVQIGYKFLRDWLACNMDCYLRSRMRICWYVNQLQGSLCVTSCGLCSAVYEIRGFSLSVQVWSIGHFVNRQQLRLFEGL